MRTYVSQALGMLNFPDGNFRKYDSHGAEALMRMRIHSTIGAHFSRGSVKESMANFMMFQ